MICTSKLWEFPWGGNASPFIADLFLSHLEYKYMMDKNNPINLKHALSNNKRYLDDILVLNVKDFIDISKIYIYQSLFLSLVMALVMKIIS